MSQKKQYLTVIPARGGSKRLKQKNILELDGKPLISWTIEAAKSSKYLTNVVVSSDDDAILALAKENGVTALQRPIHLASDTASTVDVLKHTLEIYSGYEYIVLLQTTSPLRDSKHIDEAIVLLEEKRADAVVSVCKTEHSPLWTNTLAQNMSMEGFMKKELYNSRSQDLEEFYRLNGAIYICKVEKFLEEETLFLEKNIYAYVMQNDVSVDIDTRVDFLLCEALIKERKERC